MVIRDRAQRRAQDFWHSGLQGFQVYFKSHGQIPSLGLPHWAHNLKLAENHVVIGRDTDFQDQSIKVLKQWHYIRRESYWVDNSSPDAGYQKSQETMPPAPKWHSNNPHSCLQP